MFVPECKSTLGVVIPTRFEASALLSRYPFKSKKNIFEATIDGRRILVLVSGVGRERARQAAYLLVGMGAKELVSAGFCGALQPELNVGDLVTDRLITVDQPASTPEQRAALTQKVNAQAVDMETQAVIEAGTRCGVPIRVLRVVSDRVEDDLTPLLGTGEFSAIKIAFRLLNPLVWPLALKLRQQSQTARESLAQSFGVCLRGAHS